MPLKCCNICGKQKPHTIANFSSYTTSSGKASLRGTCKPCMSERAKRHHRERPDLRKASLDRRRQRLHRAEGFYSPSDIDRLRKTLRDTCFYCGEALNGGWHVDHMLPVSKGGTNWPSNLTLACATCNGDKHSKDAAAFVEWRRKRALFCTRRALNLLKKRKDAELGAGSSMKPILFNDLVAEIKQEYERLGHERGWRFLTSPARTLSPKTRAVFITLNPGGDHAPSDHPSESCESGSAYVVERWSGNPPGRHKLQIQIQELFKVTGLTFENTLSGQLVPFRSPTWDALPRREESLEFGKRLWARIIGYVQPSLVVVMGKSQLRDPLCEILGNTVESRDVPVKWGAITAGFDRFDNCVLLSLPHLSRFGLMTRLESRRAIVSLTEMASGCK